jgi:hypothetical protein
MIPIYSDDSPLRKNRRNSEKFLDDIDMDLPKRRSSNQSKGSARKANKRDDDSPSKTIDKSKASETPVGTTEALQSLKISYPLIDFQWTPEDFHHNPSTSSHSDYLYANHLQIFRDLVLQVCSHESEALDYYLKRHPNYDQNPSLQYLLSVLQQILISIPNHIQKDLNSLSENNSFPTDFVFQPEFSYQEKCEILTMIKQQEKLQAKIQHLNHQINYLNQMEENLKLSMAKITTMSETFRRLQELFHHYENFHFHFKNYEEFLQSFHRLFDQFQLPLDDFSAKMKSMDDVLHTVTSLQSSLYKNFQEV